MNRETVVYFNPKEESTCISFRIHGPIVTVSFNVRCPTEKWNYYLPFGIDIHSDIPLFESLNTACDCDCRPSGKCYCDGSGLAGQALWERFRITGDKEIIWKELEEWLNRN